MYLRKSNYRVIESEYSFQLTYHLGSMAENWVDPLLPLGSITWEKKQLSLLYNQAPGKKNICIVGPIEIIILNAVNLLVVSASSSCIRKLADKAAKCFSWFGIKGVSFILVLSTSTSQLKETPSLNQMHLQTPHTCISACKSLLHLLWFRSW